MSKSKLHQSSEICGDCGAADPSWASVNRGILLCTQCCHTHRTLGRHVSIIKSLNKSQWPPSQITMLHTLNNNGVNSIWEHSLDKDSKSSKKKPLPTDSIEEKARFIKSKHQSCDYLFRTNNEDGQVCVENELGKQLHSSVRSNNLLTSFRLLIQGADPNYFHDEKGSTPLHAATKANQILQVELLLIYGADSTYPDATGKTPIDYAKQGVNKALTNRLIESQFEVTDTFSNYLCHRKPDHEKGVDYLIPPTWPKSCPMLLDKLKKVLSQYQWLCRCMAIHSSTFNLLSSEFTKEKPVEITQDPFVKKIMQLSNFLFEELIKDVFDEVDRRETEAIWLGSADTVDFSPIPFLPVDPSLSTTRNQSRQKLGRFASPELKALVYDLLIDSQRRQKVATRYENNLSQISDDDPLYDSVASDDDYATIPTLKEEAENGFALDDVATDLNQNPVDQTSDAKYEKLLKKLAESNKTISELRTEITNLKSLVEHLCGINHELKTTLTNGNYSSVPLDNSPMVKSEEAAVNNLNNPSSIVSSNKNNNEEDLRSVKRPQRPSSMYETREGLRTPNWQALKNQIKQNEQGIKGPQNQNVMSCTEQVTRGIADLWKCIQGSGKMNCIQHADVIRFAVTNLIHAIPVESSSVTVKHLLDSVSFLQTNCIGLQNACKTNDAQSSEFYIQKVRSWAYEIARDTKILVTKYNSH